MTNGSTKALFTCAYTPDEYATKLKGIKGKQAAQKNPMDRFVKIPPKVFLVEGCLRMIGPYQRGFFCDDESIRLPYKTSTVPLSMLLLYWPLFTSFMFLSVEYFRLTHPTISNQHLAVCEQGRCLKTRLLVRYTILNGYLLLALVSTHILTGVTKFSVGRLRPHFIDVCRPNVNLTDCSLFSHQYITSFECTGKETWHKLMETRLSFFSGHAAFSMCAVTFCLLYLQRRLGGLCRRSILLNLVQVLTLSTGLFVSYSRIFDHMHHSTDVLVGMVIGCFIAKIVFYMYLW